MLRLLSLSPFTKLRKLFQCDLLIGPGCKRGLAYLKSYLRVVPFSFGILERTSSIPFYYGLLGSVHKSLSMKLRLHLLKLHDEDLQRVLEHLTDKAITREERIYRFEFLCCEICKIQAGLENLIRDGTNKVTGRPYYRWKKLYQRNSKVKFFAAEYTPTVQPSKKSVTVNDDSTSMKTSSK